MKKFKTIDIIVFVCSFCVTFFFAFGLISQMDIFIRIAIGIVAIAIIAAFVYAETRSKRNCESKLEEKKQQKENIYKT